MNCSGGRNGVKMPEARLVAENQQSDSRQLPSYEPAMILLLKILLDLGYFQDRFQ